MIAFVTLLLGLVSGSYPIEVSISGPVARVEILLDGKVVRWISSPPWRTEVPFGASLEPHELVARALDEKGEELARTAQWINLPRPPAEVEIVLESEADGRPSAARLSWQSVDGAAPTSIAVTLDDKPLVLDAQRRALLPRCDLSRIHVLDAEIDFGRGVAGRKEVVFGGEYGSSISTELTAVVVRAPKPGAELAPSALQGRLVASGLALDVAAVERGPGRVIVVRVPGPQPLHQRWLPFDQGLDARGGVRPEEVMGGASSGSSHRAASAGGMRLGEDVDLRLLSPAARGFAGDGVASDLFPLSPALNTGSGDLLRPLTEVGLASAGSGAATAALRIADAVAVAGLQAAAFNHRRAVVLILDERSADASRYSAETVRRYLAAIRVPLYVWSPSGAKAPSAQGWGAVEDVSTLPKLHRAASRLTDDVEGQRIVWVEGQHLPQTVKLAPRAGGVELVLPGGPGAGLLEPQAAR